jgi:hypothetical protein
MRDGKLSEYLEVANLSMALVGMDFAPERVVELMRWQNAEQEAVGSATPSVIFAPAQ